MNIAYIFLPLILALVVLAIRADKRKKHALTQRVETSNDDVQFHPAFGVSPTKRGATRV